MGKCPELSNTSVVGLDDTPTSKAPAMNIANHKENTGKVANIAIFLATC